MMVMGYYERRGGSFLCICLISISHIQINYSMSLVNSCSRLIHRGLPKPWTACGCSTKNRQMIRMMMTRGTTSSMGISHSLYHRSLFYSTPIAPDLHQANNKLLRNTSALKKFHHSSTKLRNSSSNNNGDGSTTVNGDGEYKFYNGESDEQIMTKTKKWIKNVVIGLNFCPFAERSMAKSQLFFDLVRGDDIEEIVSSVLYQCLRRQDNEGTTVVICPDLYPLDFQAGYLDVLNIIQELLEDGDLSEDIQIAPFHPLFEFEETENRDAIENFTNRSPYPIFHILREEEVAVAVKRLDGDSSKVYQRNINLLNKMEEVLGREKAENAMKGNTIEGLQELLRERNFD